MNTDDSTSLRNLLGEQPRVAGLYQIDQIIWRRWAIAGGLAAVGGAELGQDVRHVHAGGLSGDEQVGGDVAVAAPGGDQRSTSNSRSVSPSRSGRGWVLSPSGTPARRAIEVVSASGRASS
jgi:hypothetical protein